MGVSGTNIRRLGNYGGRVDTDFIGHVIDREGVFVVTIADLFALVFCVWTMIDETFGIVDIAILTSTAWRPRVGDIGDVDVDQARAACAVSWLSSDNGEPVCSFRTFHNVMGTADG